MRATVYMLTCAVTLGLTLHAPGAIAAVSIAPWTMLAGQANRASRDSALTDDKARADALIKQARQEMKNGNLQLADYLITKAEELNVPYDSLFARLSDSPVKARRDLEQLRDVGTAGPRLPSERFSIPPLPFTSRNETEADTMPRDPFEARRERDGAVEAITDDAKARAVTNLEKGRAALGQGDRVSALAFYQKAVSAGASFAPGEFGPAQLADQLRRAGVTEQQIAAASRGPSMPGNVVTRPWEVNDQGEEPLALRAARGFAATRPEAERDGAFPLEVPGQETRGVADVRGLGAVGPSATAESAGDRGRSDALLREARRALAQGDIKTASERISQARRLGVIYQLHEDSPRKIEALIESAKGFRGFTPQASGDASRNKAFAQLLLDQAEGLLPYNENVLARQLAARAKDIPVPYGPFDRTPDKILQRIVGDSNSVVAGPLSPLTRPGPDPRGIPATDANRASGFEPPPGLSASPDAESPSAAPIIGDGDAPSGRLTPIRPSGFPVEEPGADTEQQSKRAEVQRLLAEARAAMDRGRFAEAKDLAERAEGLKLPDAGYGPNDVRPWSIVMQADKQLARRAAPASYQEQVAVATEEETSDGGYANRQSVYEPQRDTTRNVAAQAIAPPAGAPPENGGEGLRLFNEGMSALENLERERALTLFQQAWRHEADLDPDTRRRLREKLTLLRAAGAAPLPAPGQIPSPLEEVDANQRLVREKLTRDITSEKAAAKKLLTSDPRAALESMQQLRARINEADVDTATRKQMLTVVDQELQQFERYIQENLSEIELNERNREVLAAVERDRKVDLDIQNQIAEFVDQFNQLVDEERYAEAELIAKKARALDPDAEVVQLLVWQSRFLHRIREQQSIRERKEQGFYDALTAVDRSAEPFNDSVPLQFGDLKHWKQLSTTRRKWMEGQGHRMSPAELTIHASLAKKVDVHFTRRPLAEVLDTLQRVTGINIYLDPQGLHAEGVTSDTPVTIDLDQPVSLRSALNLILQPLHLSYVIQDEVLRVTSEQTRDTDVYPHVYNVADLVIPIPNFIPSYNIGLPGAIREAHLAQGQGTGFGGGAQMPFTVAANDAGGATPDKASVLAQMIGGPSGSGSRASQPLGQGPGGLGGAAAADFDTLIELIVNTISPQSWDEVGGPGSIEGFPTNLSLVVSQTQEVHEQIADLLEQLRRLQDLQVTIEVRFITLNDNFFERIGIDFDFDIDDNSTLNPANPAFPDDTGPSIVVGLDSSGLPTADLDLSFTSDSFGSAVPQFGGFDAGSAANFGFAILSDIEVFFLLQASQGDTRSNVLQAPKVTLFNGQQAFVADTSQRPFVTSVIPVVGDFAAAHQPVIVVLSEGTSLSVQAVVSNDRRFVRLTLVPFFSTIGEVEEFTFTGSTTTNSGTNIADPTNDEETLKNNVQTTREGTTVQLPTFSFTTVTTTVSVPDGGTVLLGGIKRLTEGRNERGVPMLSKIPYISRLFKNVGIGRTTQSLMMMVTPRIIIQEEEEEKMGIEAGQ